MLENTANAPITTSTPNNPTGYAQVLEELLGGVVQKSYTIGHDVFAEAIAANQLRHLLKDGHNSTRQLVDATGNIITHDGTPSGTLQIYAYDAYGLPLGFTPANALTTLLYNTEQLDTRTGLQYLRARYYDLATGRFNRLDPFAGNMRDPRSLQKYLYAHADPINGIDPTGLLWGAICGFAMTTAFRLGEIATMYPMFAMAYSLATMISVYHSVEMFMLGYDPETGEELGVAGYGLVGLSLVFDLAPGGSGQPLKRAVPEILRKSRQLRRQLMRTLIRDHDGLMSPQVSRRCLEFSEDVVEVVVKRGGKGGAGGDVHATLADGRMLYREATTFGGKITGLARKIQKEAKQTEALADPGDIRQVFVELKKVVTQAELDEQIAYARGFVGDAVGIVVFNSRGDQLFPHIP